MMYKKYIKRLFDFVLSLLALIVLLPVFVILSVFVRINLGNPVIFSQERATKNGKSFYIKKFRSMNNAKDKDGNYLPDEERITPFGKFLRATSLDELPELIGIIKGDLSIIGPRPLPCIYDNYYTECEKNRYMVRAGLIPPEVLYENIQPTWEQQLEYEADYAENVSFLLDIKILFAVFKGLFIRYNKDYGNYVREPLHIERQAKELKK